MAAVCAAWQETLDAATRSSLLARPHWAWAPVAWDPTRSCWETPAQPWATAQRVVVLVDNREPKPGLEHKLTSLCCEGVRYREETLATGDFLFLLEPAAEGNDSPLGGKRVLPVIIERKTPSDLASSLEDNRYQSQIRKMVASGLAIKVYLVEGKIDDLTPEQQALLDELATTKGFHIVYTTNGWKTALTLGQIARLLNEGVISGSLQPSALPTMDEITTRVNRAGGGGGGGGVRGGGGGQFGRMTAIAPPNLGRGLARPEAPAGCLVRLKFAKTGIMDSLPDSELGALLNKYGATLEDSVKKSTDFLIQAWDGERWQKEKELVPFVRKADTMGESKYDKAKKMTSASCRTRPGSTPSSARCPGPALSTPKPLG